MTIQQLSDRSVKVQLPAEEAYRLLHNGADAKGSGQLYWLMICLMIQAEKVCGIPFSSSKVAAELMQDSKGGLTAYFSAESLRIQNRESRAVRLAAVFPDRDTLRICCRQLFSEKAVILRSALYKYRGCWILTLRLIRTGAVQPYHLLLEYGTLFRMTPVNRARLTEFGRCLLRSKAVEQFALIG